MADVPDEVLNERILRLVQAALRGHYDRDFVPQIDRIKSRTYADLPDHTRKWLEGQSPDDLAEIDDARKLVDRLAPGTCDWLKGKSPKDLQNIDTAVEFIGSSRTAARVLLWISSGAFLFITSAWALAKAGIDAFALFRGGIR